MGVLEALIAQAPFKWRGDTGGLKGLSEGSVVDTTGLGRVGDEATTILGVDCCCTATGLGVECTDGLGALEPTRGDLVLTTRGEVVGGTM